MDDNPCEKQPLLILHFKRGESMKKRKLPIIILFIVLISIAISFILFISLIIKSSKLKPEEYTIFDNLEQLNVLDEYIIKTNITEYLSFSVICSKVFKV